MSWSSGTRVVASLGAWPQWTCLCFLPPCMALCTNQTDSTALLGTLPSNAFRPPARHKWLVQVPTAHHHTAISHPIPSGKISSWVRYWQFFPGLWDRFQVPFKNGSWFCLSNLEKRSMPTFFLSMRTLQPAQNISCHAHIFCLKSCLAREMLGFVESGFISRAKNVVWAGDKMFWAGSNVLIERKKVGMERFSRFESQNHEPFLRHLKPDSQTWKSVSYDFIIF